MSNQQMHIGVDPAKGKDETVISWSFLMSDGRRKTIWSKRRNTSRITTVIRNVLTEFVPFMPKRLRVKLALWLIDGPLRGQDIGVSIEGNK